MDAAELVLVGARKRFPAEVQRAQGVRALKAAEVRDGFRSTSAGRWVAVDAHALRPLLVEPGPSRQEARLLLLTGLEPSDREALLTRFRHVITANHLRLLPLEALFEVLLSPSRDDLFIGGVASGAAESVVLYTGALRPLVVPRGWFTRRPGGPAPDFDDLEVIDYGQTVRLGGYEVAADAMLYEFDAGYRRRSRRAAVEADASFGGALRRLRLQRGLERNEIPGLSARTVARIERGEVDRPRGRTLERLAEALRVRPEEIGSY